MLSQIKTVLSLVIISALLLGGGLLFGDKPATADGEELDFPLIELPEKGNPKLDSQLNQLASAKTPQRAASFALESSIELVDDNVRVIVECLPDQIDTATEAVSALGTIETSYRSMLQVTVSITSLTALADTPSIRFVRLPRYPLPAVVSEGVALINADDWQTAGYTGTGVKVAILDGGFTGYSSLLGTELPSSVTTQSFYAGTDIEGYSVHGTACAEIVYDIAPGAQFYLVNCGTDIEFANAVDWLIAQSVDVISFSAGWFLGGPGDGTGTICDKVADARNAGILWSNSIGNHAQMHWQGDFVDTDADDLHEYSGDDETNEITVGTGNTITITLKWDDTWGASGNDYDLWLLDKDLTLVDWSGNPQDGDDDPWEGLSYTATYSGDYHIVIYRCSASQTVNFHLYSAYHDLNYPVASSSFLVPADSPSAMAVGAVNYSTPGTLESFSSRGPTKDSRIKPDLVAPDGVSTATYGASNFYGTSASAPHATGMAALVKQLFPSYTPAQIQSFLEGKAIDLGGAGKDNLYGSGRLDLTDSTPPSMEAIAEAEGQYYNTAPSFSNFGFDDDLALDDGWYQMDSFAGAWTTLFTDVAGTSWDNNGWTILGYGALAEGSHTIYFKASDDIGNVEGESGEWSWQFYKDTNPPADPTGVTSTSHTISTWSSDNTVDITWTAASDNVSGLDGYSILWDTSPTTIPDQTKDIEEGVEATNSSALADGNSHYFHIRSVDNVGNWQSTVHVGPFFIDTTPPTTEAIAEAEGQYYTVAPSFANFGFDDNLALDDGWYQMDSYSGNWTALFTDVAGTSWDSDGWTIPGFGALAEGSHTIYFKSSDDASNVEGESGEWSWQFYKDTNPPTDPTDVTSISHTLSVWSSDNTVDVTWTASSDNVSGLDGYSILWDTSPATIPDQTKDIEEGVEATTSSALADGNSHYFHIRSVDNVGNWQSTVHLGPFFIDTTPPTDPTDVTSTSHTVSTWSSDNTVDITWTDATDSGSGLDGYSILWDTGPSTIPDQTKDIEEGVEATTSSALADGNSHYFHIRSVDNAGNWQSTVHVGPFFIDTTDLPTMEPIVELEGQYYTVAPSFSNFGFDDDLALDDGWYQMDSFAGAWTALFTDVAGTSWDSDGWTIPGFGALAEGSHTIYFKASDDASNVEGESGEWSWQFYKDTTPPTDPTGVTSTSHTVSTWSSDNTVDITWTDATDSGSGLDGYSILWDTSPSTIPDQTKDIEEGVEATTSSALADGDSHYFHIRSVDNVGNWQSTVHLGPFFIDTTPPTDPTGVTSTSHTISTWSSNNTVDITWTDATDSGSGLDGYSILWDTGPSTIPDQTKDIEEGVEATTSSALADGNSHYFHIRSVDNAGNWQSTVHLGPFFIDANPPAMEAIAEAEGQYYTVAPSFSNFGFDDDLALDDGWYQMDSFAGAWTTLFTDVAGTSWDGDGWTIPGFGALAEGSHTIYFKSSDDIGNVEGESGEWSWQFYKDTAPPTDPTDVTSTSHALSVWSSDNTVDVTWTDATDSASGLDGYSILWDTSPATIPDQTKDIEEGVEATTSSALADGNSHYFHIRSVDNAGNWQSTVHLGPFFIDANPPTMEAIAEAEGQYYNTAPSFSNFGFDDDLTLDDGWYQMDSFSGNWTALFTDVAGTSWDSDGWTIPAFGALAEGSHTIYFKSSDDIGNVEGESGEWSWQFYKDVTPPSAVTDLATTNPTGISIALTWTAPADAVSGTTTYDIRYSTANITAANWGSATECTGEPTPSAAGSTEAFTVTGLSDNITYCFALKTADKVPNWSTLSNLASATTQNIPPVLSDGAVSPTSEYTSATFTYYVTYTDAENDAPSSITVSIDGGTPVAMTVQSGQDGVYSNGEIYEYTTTGSTLGTGSHNFQFAASDGIDNATGDVGLHSGPTVSSAGGGGGGAATTTEPSEAPGVTDVSDCVDEDGVFNEEVCAESEDGKVELTIDAGTTGQTEAGEALSELSITEMEEPPAAPADCCVIGLTYDLGPDGATFDPPIILTFAYDPDDIPGDFDEEDLVIAMWDENVWNEETGEWGDWVDLEGPFVVDTVTHTITTPVSGFSAFTILAYTRPAAFTTADLTITPTRVDIGDTVTISVLVTNTGDLIGSYEVVLKIDDVAVATEDVTLSGGDTQTVTFTTSKGVAGNYTVHVNGLSGTFTVKTPPAPPVAAVAPAPASFTVSDLSVTPSEVEPAEQVTVSAVVSNTGGSEGSYTVLLKINGIEEARKEVTLEPDSSEAVAFTITRDMEGSYTVTIDNKVGQFTVIVPQPVAEPPTESTRPVNWTLIWGIIGGVLILGLILWLAVFRRWLSRG